ncbi:MAG: hypothetical protein ABIH11_05355 [Candidatus Altiarchaeota archaeon]
MPIDEDKSGGRRRKPRQDPNELRQHQAEKLGGVRRFASARTHGSRKAITRHSSDRGDELFLERVSPRVEGIGFSDPQAVMGDISEILREGPTSFHSNCMVDEMLSLFDGRNYRRGSNMLYTGQLDESGRQPLATSDPDTAWRFLRSVIQQGGGARFNDEGLRTLNNVILSYEHPSEFISHLASNPGRVGLLRDSIRCIPENTDVRQVADTLRFISSEMPGQLARILSREHSIRNTILPLLFQHPEHIDEYRRYAQTPSANINTSQQPPAAFCINPLTGLCVLGPASEGHQGLLEAANVQGEDRGYYVNGLISRPRRSQTTTLRFDTQNIVQRFGQDAAEAMLELAAEYAYDLGFPNSQVQFEANQNPGLDGLNLSQVVLSGVTLSMPSGSVGHVASKPPWEIVESIDDLGDGGALLIQKGRVCVLTGGTLASVSTSLSHFGFCLFGRDESGVVHLTECNTEHDQKSSSCKAIEGQMIAQGFPRDRIRNEGFR